MNKFIKIYLIALPIITIISLLVGGLTSGFNNLRAVREIFLITNFILDIFIIGFGRKYLVNKTLSIIIILLLISFIVGLLNYNDLSRRFITDFTNPFFFFAKIIIFRTYWKYNDFDRYIKYYVKIGFWCSFAILPVVYYLLRSTDATRMAMFPPMEIPFTYLMQSGGVYFILSLFIILLYGKRAQLIGAIFTFILFVFLFKKKHFFKYVIVVFFVIFINNYLFEKYSDNYAISRLNYTFQVIDESEDDMLSTISGGRVDEIEAIIKEMDFPLDYLFGKGFGFVYFNRYEGNITETANAHFTPIGLLSKYGLFFTIFVYIYILGPLFKYKKVTFDKAFITAFGTVVFVFIESFFSYALFVTPILPVTIGYILYRQSSYSDS